MNTRYKILVCVLATLALMGAGCVTVGGSGSDNSGSDGGVFKSGDRGETWVQKTAILTATGEKKSFSGLSVSALAQDPQDPNALYVGTADAGILYSYDGGESWAQAPGLKSGMVAGIAVHPKNKCTIYATSGNRLMKTDDCSRTWTAVFVDARPERKTSAVTVDWFNPDIVWLGEDAGDLLRSTDGGKSWEKVDNFGTEVVKIAFNPIDSRQMYVCSLKHGVWRTDDGGMTPTWLDLSEKYKDFDGAKEFRDFAVSVADPKTIILASKYGLIRSKDNGENWEAINLLTPPGGSAIYSLALDPRDANVIYYGTATTFHRTSDGGLNWVPKKLVTTRAATQLLVDRANSAILYMGTTKFKK
ncbi:MAG: YCF48-related protein [Patescibacteria group bacterium]|nr:YCF48-related protein [Patescibacteria group bacterium]